MPRPKKTMNAEGQYLCSRCKWWKLPEEFGKNSAMSNGLHPTCKKCLQLSQAERNEKIRLDRHRADHRENYGRSYPYASPEAIEVAVELQIEFELASSNDEKVQVLERIQDQEYLMRTGRARYHKPTKRWVNPNLTDEELAELGIKRPVSAQENSSVIPSDLNGHVEAEEEDEEYVSPFYKAVPLGPPPA